MAGSNLETASSITVAQDGSGHYSSIQEAVDQAQSGTSACKTVIWIKNGVYREKLHVDKPFLHLKGESAEGTVITYDDYARKKFPDGSEYHTFHSYTALISTNDITAENLTFRNDAGRGEVVGQALAAYVDGNRIHFRGCRFIGHQDTLFTGPLPDKPLKGGRFGGPRDGAGKIVGRQWYEQCYIEGDVDFIFGSATAVFTECEIFSRNRLTEENRANIGRHSDINGWITAASTPEDRSYGYVFIDCRLTGDAPPNSVYLGRPWRNHAKVAFINCWLGPHIRLEGWDNWNKPESEETVVYIEFGSKGPGAALNERVSWSQTITGEQVNNYTLANVISGEDQWDPA